MSNAPQLLKALMQKCQGRDGECSRAAGGRHVTANGKVGKDAAVYPAELCRAIVRGMVAEMKDRGIHRAGEVGLHAVTDVDGDPDHDERFSGTYRDDISVQILRDDLVREARQNELRYFCEKGVWVKRPRTMPGARLGRAQSQCAGSTSTKVTT